MGEEEAKLEVAPEPVKSTFKFGLDDWAHCDEAIGQIVARRVTEITQKYLPQRPIVEYQFASSNEWWSESRLKRAKVSIEE